MKILIVTFRIGGKPAPPAPRYDPSTHRPACRERHAATEAWARQWPNHCQKCHGAGEISYDDDPSPAGVALSPGRMTFTDPCTCVTDDLRCPRCGESLLGPILRHPRRHLAQALRVGWTHPIRALGGDGLVASILRLAGLPPKPWAFATRRITHRLGQIDHAITCAVYDLADGLAPIPDETPACAFCGWTGKGAGDVQPWSECTCWEAHEAEVAQAVVTGAICWRCERPFVAEHPGIQVRLPIVGTRWIHPGCVLGGDRIVESDE